ncbi:MAG: hypothetical protein KA149_13190, partial [Chitinophagales bacterium]|nr:hypothetical protein [Chitinophagales bacterium]
PYDDNTTSDASALAGNQTPTLCGAGWNGYHTYGNFLGRLDDGCMNHNHAFTTSAAGVHDHLMPMYAHRHWLKQRATGDESQTHTHTVPSRNLNFNLSVDGAQGASITPETRPVNQAAIFWRRTN